MAASAPILATKLYLPPLAPKVVLCSRLIEQLNETASAGGTPGVFAAEINARCPSQAYFINRFDWVLYHGTPVARTWALAGNLSWKKEKIYEYPHNIYLVINEK